MRTPCLLRSGIALLALGAAASASADERMLDGFSVSLGAYASNIDSSVFANGTNENGTAIDLHRDLNLPDSRSLPFVDVTWRPWDRHEFTFNYFSDEESNSRSLTRDITIRDKVFTAGADVHSKISLDSYGFGYRYWAYVGDENAFGVGGGLQWYSVSLKLSGHASVVGPGGSIESSGELTAKASTDIPDPFIGVSWRYQALDWMRVVADLGAFKANIGDVDARLYNGRVGVEFYPWQNIGIVTQYSYNKIDADVTKDSFNGNATFRFDGFQVLAKFRF